MTHTPAMAETPEQERQRRFPRALYQPPGSYRFGADALLLACFLHAEPGSLVADFGCGCGAAGLAMALRCPGIRLVAIDAQPELCRAAALNARRLGLLPYAAVQADLAAPPMARGAFDIVLANPPFYRPGSGRLPKARLRRAALFETNNELAHFCRAACLALRPGGRLALIFPAARENDLLRALHNARLSPATILPVAPREGQPPIRLLVEARRQHLGDVQPVTRLSPLCLHEDRGAFSERALVFCPFLASDRAEDEALRKHAEKGGASPKARGKMVSSRE